MYLCSGASLPFLPFWSFWFRGAEVLSCSWRNFCTTRSVFSPSNTTKFAPSGLRTLGLEEEKCWVWCNKPILRAGLVTPIVRSIRFFLDQQKSGGKGFFGAKRKKKTSIHLPMNQLRKLFMAEGWRQGGQPKNQPLGMFPFFVKKFPWGIGWRSGVFVCFFSRKNLGEYQLVIHPSAIFQPKWGQRLAMFDFWRGPSNKWSHEISRPTVHWTGYYYTSEIERIDTKKWYAFGKMYTYIYIYVYIRLQNIWFLFWVSILNFSGVLLLRKIVPSWIRWIINYPK